MTRDADWAAARAAAHAAGAALRPLLPASADTPLSEAAGRFAAADVRALADLPHYASSAMDGWAVAGPGPWRLRPAPPGHGRPAPLAPGDAVPILTGGALPEGATAVLRRERGRPDGAGLRAEDDPDAGADIRPAGREAAAGEVLVPAGARITPGAVAAAAVAGHDTLPTAPPAPVRLVYTGDEVLTRGLPAAGQVRDSFGPVLPACVAGLGGSVAGTVRIGDDAAATRDALDGPGARRAAVVVTTGGTGSSPADHIRPVARALGAEALVDGVAMRPGHPALLARLPGGRLLVGLPGNPLAALMAVATLLEPVLRGAAGAPPLDPRLALAGEELPGGRGGHRLVPARWAGAGALVPAEHTGSAMMRGLSGADAVLVIPPGGAPAGTPVPWLPLPW